MDKKVGNFPWKIKISAWEIVKSGGTSSPVERVFNFGLKTTFVK